MLLISKEELYGDPNGSLCETLFIMMSNLITYNIRLYISSQKDMCWKEMTLCK